MVAACSSAPFEPDLGSLQIRSVSTGAPMDPDGYRLTISGESERVLGANGVLTLEHLTPGSYELRLSGVAPNCEIQNPNPLVVTVSAGGPTTAVFEIHCGLPAVLEVSVRTEGEDPDDDGYVLSLDDSFGAIVERNTLKAFAPLIPGEHTVRLTDLAPNCQLNGPSERTVSVVQGTTTRVELIVTCPRLLPGSLMVTLTVSLINWPNFAGKFSVSVDQLDWHPIAAGGSMLLEPIAGGAHTVRLAAPPGCGFFGFPAPNPQSVWVPSGGVAHVRFAVGCIG